MPMEETAVVAFPASANVPVPVTILQTPFPLAGVIAAKVVLPEHKTYGTCRSIDGSYTRMCASVWN